LKPYFPDVEATVLDYGFYGIITIACNCRLTVSLDSIAAI